MKLQKISRFLPLVLSAIASANAAEVVWSGVTDAQWSIPTNWVGNAAPLAADSAAFLSTSTANTSISLTAATTVAGLKLNNAGNPVTIGGAFNLTAGILTVDGSNSLTVQNGASAFGITSLNGAGFVTINKSNTLNWTVAGTLDAANDLNFTGKLSLRGGTATTNAGVTAGSWTAIGGATCSQVAGTAFALDTGASVDTSDGNPGARDLILGDSFTGSILNLSSLSGYGAIRCDWGGIAGTVTRTVNVNQASDTTFQGMFLSHHGTSSRIRNLALIKEGAGKLTMTGLVGRQTVSAGGTSDQVPITVNGGTLALTANNTRQGAVTIANGATLELGDGGTTGTMGTGAVTNNGSLVFNYGAVADITASNAISGNGIITKNGEGSVALTANSSSFTGNIHLNAGWLRIGPNPGTGTLTVKSGTFISVGLPATNGTSQVGALTLENLTESDFRLGVINDRIEVTNTDGLTAPPVAGTHTINIFNQPNEGGTITLIDYSGTALTTEQFNRFVLGILPGGLAGYALVNNTANTSIDLLITLEDQVWKGSTDGNWDGIATNWALASAPGTPMAFSFDNPALFNDSAAIYAVIVEAAGVYPLSTTFNNSLNAYTFTGGEIGGTTSLEKNGTHSVTLSQPNSYTGGTIINAGKLQIGSGGTAGDIGGGAVTIASGTNLEFNRSNTTPGTADLNYKTSAKMRNVSGAGDIVLTGGLLFFNYPGSGTGFSEAGSWNNFSGNLTVKGGSEFQTIRNGATAMGSGDIILGDGSSSGILSQIEGNWTWSNDIILTGSDNRIRNRSGGVPPTNRALKIQGIISGSGGLTFEDAAGTMNDLNRGFILTNTNTMSGTLTIAAATPVRVGGTPGDTDINQDDADVSGTLGMGSVVNHGTLTFSRTNAHAVANSISGSGALRIGIPTGLGFGDTSTQVLTYTGTATHAGATTVHNGKLIVGTGASIGGSSVTVEAGASLGGTGTVAAPLAAAGTVAPGIGIGTLPVTGNTSLTGTLAIEVDGATVDKLSVTGDLTLAGALTLTENGAGFTGTSYVIAECTGALTGVLTAPAGYSISLSGSQVIVSKATGYQAWAATNAGGQASNLDFDNDGVSNGVEYFMGETGSTFTANPALVITGVTRTVTWPRDPDAVASYKIQISDTLAAAGWTDITPPHASIDETNPNQVVFTLPSANPRKFCRLSVTVAP